MNIIIMNIFQILLKVLMVHNIGAPNENSWYTISTNTEKEPIHT